MYIFFSSLLSVWWYSIAFLVWFICSILFYATFLAAGILHHTILSNFPPRTVSAVGLFVITSPIHFPSIVNTLTIIISPKHNANYSYFWKHINSLYTRICLPIHEKQTCFEKPIVLQLVNKRFIRYNELWNARCVYQFISPYRKLNYSIKGNWIPIRLV